jgi:hypothetical protein
MTAILSAPRSLDGAAASGQSYQTPASDFDSRTHLLLNNCSGAHTGLSATTVRQDCSHWPGSGAEAEIPNLRLEPFCLISILSGLMVVEEAGKRLSDRIPHVVPSHVTSSLTNMLL